MRIGASTNPYLQHQNAFTADRLSRAAEPSMARVTTREIGFSIGGFGLRWQSSDVEFDDAATAAREAARKEADQARAFREELDVAVVRERLAGAATGVASAAPALAASGQTGASGFAYALSAYTRIAGLASFEPLPGRMLGVA